MVTTVFSGGVDCVVGGVGGDGCVGGVGSDGHGLVVNNVGSCGGLDVARAGSSCS